MPDPFTIRIFVPEGDPEGVRIIDRMNWTGVGIAFPRARWPEIRNRAEFAKPGVYVLVGYVGDEDDDLPTVYIGQGDGTKGRIEQHAKQKDFWEWGIAFASTSGGLNRAHITWLEYALVNRAAEAKRCHLDNGNVEAALTKAEKADTQGFFKEILQILPLVGLRVFEFAKPVAIPKATSAEALRPTPTPHQPDTIGAAARHSWSRRACARRSAGRPASYGASGGRASGLGEPAKGWRRS